MLGAGLMAFGLASTAQAQSSPRRQAVTPAEAERAAGVGASRRALRVDDRGRWSVDFSLSPSTEDPARVGDVGAGAYWRVSPRLSVGASAGVSARPPSDPARRAQGEREGEPRVRLESIFRF